MLNSNECFLWLWLIFKKNFLELSLNFILYTMTDNIYFLFAFSYQISKICNLNILNYITHIQNGKQSCEQLNYTLIK